MKHMGMRNNKPPQPKKRLILLLTVTLLVSIAALLLTCTTKGTKKYRHATDCKTQGNYCKELITTPNLTM